MASNPKVVSFTQQQVKDNLSAQRALADLLPVLDDAEKCGVDVTGYRAIAQGLTSQLQEIANRFMQQPNLGS